MTSHQSDARADDHIYSSADCWRCGHECVFCCCSIITWLY